MSVYNLEKDGDIFISPHSQLKEYRSHIDGKTTTNTIILDDEVPVMFEKVFKAAGATKGIITSGYRDVKTDKAVGGTGKGMHVEGKAIDVIFYKGNKIIDTKLLSCIAQDLGIGGIARINDRAIHLDVRKGSRYLGDETKSKNTVTKDFYDYYNIKRPEKKYREEVKKRFGFDKSTIDFLEGHPYPEDLFEKLATKG